MPSGRVEGIVTDGEGDDQQLLFIMVMNIKISTHDICENSCYLEFYSLEISLDIYYYFTRVRKNF